MLFIERPKAAKSWKQISKISNMGHSRPINVQCSSASVLQRRSGCNNSLWDSFKLIIWESEEMGDRAKRPCKQ